MNTDEILKIREWERIILRPIKRDILNLIRARTIVSQSELRKLLFSMGHKGRKFKNNPGGPYLTWTAIHKHIVELEKSGLIYRTDYPTRGTTDTGIVRPTGEGSYKGVSTLVGYKLTAEGRDFLYSLDRNEGIK